MANAKVGPLTYVTIVLLALFGLVDYTAHATHYENGETFSRFVQNLERRIPWLRALVGALCLLLFTHLTFELP